MYNIICFILSVIVFSWTQSWAICTSGSYLYSQGLTLPDCYSGRNCNRPGYIQGVTLCSDVLQECGHGCPPVVDVSRVIGGVLSSSFLTANYAVNSSTCLNSNGGCTHETNTPTCYYNVRCTSQAEADSVNCVQKGGAWNSNDATCDICEQNDTTYTEISCAYDALKGQYLNIANKVTIVNCQATVQEHQYYAAACDSNCNSSSDLTCLGSVDGINVFLRSCNGRVTKCDADGSCSFALQKVAAGECENPNDSPDNNNGSSSSSAGQSESSSSGGVGAADSLGWLKDSLRVLHITDSAGFAEINNNLENIQPFVAGTYDQVTDIAGTVHDINTNLLTGFDFLNDIKENTGNTANNTNGINNKLSTTNSLLEQINNKNFSTTVNVSPPEVTVQGDTIINNVTVEGDTSRAPSEILSFLKSFFGGMDTTANYDTTGWGSVNDSAKKQLDTALQKSDWVASLGCDTTGGQKCDASVIGAHGLDSAQTKLKSTFGVLADTLRNGAFGDSLANWGSKFTSGTISGSGSDGCPAVLTRQYHIDLLPGAGFNLTLGRYLCQPLVGTTTAWSLCRLLFRASVALVCMWFLFHCATGFRGSSDED